MCDCKIKELSQDLGLKQTKLVKIPLHMQHYFEKEHFEFGRTKLRIDKCLCYEIIVLWKKGITTTGCCCGHNFKCPYIGVTSESSGSMKELGYKVHYNPFDPYHDNEFYPKSVKVRLKFRVMNYFMKLFRIKK